MEELLSACPLTVKAGLAEGSGYVLRVNPLPL